MYRCSVDWRGPTLGVDEFEVCEGLVLRQTYAHLMSPLHPGVPATGAR